MPATVLLVTVRRRGVVIVLGVVLAVAATVAGMVGVVLVTATAALGVRIFATHDLDGVGEHFDDGIEVFLDRLGIAGAG